MSVADATSAMANASIDDKATSGARSEAAIASVAEGRRLYIGNLAYATTEAELKEFFNGYLIESVSIPTNPRTHRPVGYALIDVSTPTEAQRAIDEMNGKTIAERKISVQLARKAEDVVEGHETGQEGTHRGQSTRGRGRGGRGRGGHARNSRQPNGAEGETAQEQPLSDATNAAPGHHARTRTPRVRGAPADGVPSKNKIMVANLPFDVTEEKLKELFAAYEPSAVKIALRPLPMYMIRKLQARNEARKGRGFAFVTVASEEMQQKACAEMNGKQIDGREIAVKVAIDSPGKEEDGHGHDHAKGEAAAPAVVEAATAA